MKRRPVLVLAPEAGSASTLGPVLRHMPDPFTLVCSARARPGLAAMGLKVAAVVNDPSSRETADALVAGLIHDCRAGAVLSTLLGPLETSLDHAAVRQTSLLGLRHVAVLDSWMHLESRFQGPMGKPGPLPSVVAVMDSATKQALVDIGLPPERVAVTGHPFFDVIQRRTSPPPQVPTRLGVVLQPLAALVQQGLLPHVGYTEREFAALVFAATRSIPPASRPRLVLREHPRLVSDFDWPEDLAPWIDHSLETDGWEFVQSCHAVVGMSGTLLVHAFLAGIPTLVAQPGISSGEDPNVLTRHGIVPNIQEPAAFAREMLRALEDPCFQRCKDAETGRTFFRLDGECCRRVLTLLD